MSVTETANAPAAKPGDHVAADILPIADIDFSAPQVNFESGQPRLIGSSCTACAAACFPRRAVCPACGRRVMEQHDLAPAGSLYSYSTVHISSSRKTPYTIGYVDLDDGVRLLANIAGDPGVLRPDMRVTLVAEGDAFSFAPAGEIP